MRPRFKWNIKGFQRLRRSAGIKQKLKSEADSLRDTAGEGYRVRTGEGKTRSRATVITGTADARREESENSSLLRAVGAEGT